MRAMRRLVVEQGQVACARIDRKRASASTWLSIELIEFLDRVQEAAPGVDDHK
jgi:hypothetical protein